MPIVQYSKGIVLGACVLGLVACADGANNEGAGNTGDGSAFAGGAGMAGLAGGVPMAGGAGLPTAGGAPVAGAAGSVPPGTGAGAGGVAGSPTTAGVGGGTDPVVAGAGGVGGTADPVGGGAGGVGGSAGVTMTGGTGGVEVMTGGTGGTDLPPGTCCPDGNCLCHGPDPSQLTSSAGPFRTANYRITTGTVFHPTDAEAPFAVVAICPGFLNSGPEMNPWGEFYASHGIVTVVVDTLGSDIPDIRAIKLLDAIEEVKGENDNSSSPLFGNLAGRFGTSGYSMGGGGTTIASGSDSSLMTSVGLAAWGPVTAGVTVPTLLLCGDADVVAPCTQTQGAYTGMPAGTPKMMISINGATHFNWFAPNDAGRGTSGMYALAFQKVYLEGDQRWKPLLLGSPANGTATTNIQ